jgi:hypothetical protein
MISLAPLVRHHAYEFLRRPHEFRFRHAVRTLWQFATSYERWEAATRTPAQWSRPERITVILQSYNRVANIEAVARAFVACACVDRIVITNNNPAYKLRDWIRIDDPRIEIIEQLSPRAATERYLIARDEPGQWFLSVDDDVFMFPEAVGRLFGLLLESPEVPHGLCGGWYRPPEGLGEEIVVHAEATVDILYRVYAFTRAHVREYFRILETLGYREDAAIRRMSLRPRERAAAGAVIIADDDVLLSFSGNGRPKIHDIRDYLNCPSEGRRNVAQWRHGDFLPYRQNLIEVLRRMKPFF